jgi:hypothetical protein
MVQLPLEMACSSPNVMVSVRMHFAMSNWVARLALLRELSAWRFRSAFILQHGPYSVESKSVNIR